MIDIKKFRTDNNISQLEICTVLGIKQPYLSAIENGKRPLNDEKFTLLYKQYGDKIMKYKTTERPILLIDEAETSLHPNIQKYLCDKLKQIETRPRIPYDAAAGTLTEAVEGITEYQCEQLPVISAFPKYDFTIRITGKSMEPEYFAGDEVACLRVNEKQFLQWGRVHVLDTTQGIVIKRIYDAGESILCRSYNSEFPDFSIPKENIRSYNLVVGSLRL
ncbi:MULTISPECIES: LexA family transcriptional regulator [Bacteroidaceae]|mgnify:CR=1 FL=1|jgi:transcriptional regulator with XRE-family HTH domain|uniref:Helix-turn-helix domain-containing protein n=1 Tax=Phocaeicola plebeius TaxID=310297 RepID=A0A3E4N394_9BACT|nr:MULTISPECIES: XRE family transcriptional regulator [Bacteroidaceae]RGK56463.1 helix-turn-helix domain-containing protein [Phocaeicola plebeius]